MFRLSDLKESLSSDDCARPKKSNPEIIICDGLHDYKVLSVYSDETDSGWKIFIDVEKDSPILNSEI